MRGLGADFPSEALEIFRHQYRRNANYRKFCGAEGRSPKTVKHWKQIPAMPAAGFKELVLATFPVKKAVKVFRTSGTTGSQRGAHFFRTLKVYDTAIIPPFKRYLLPDGAALSYYFLIHSPAQAPDSSLSYMMGRVDRVFARGRGRFYVRAGGVDHAKLAKDLKSAKKPVILLATAFSMEAFLEHLKKRKIALRLPKKSRVMETGGFKGRAREISKKRFYAQISKRLGVDPSFIVSEYGMTELTSQFYDTTLYDKIRGIRRKPFKAGPDWIRTVVIDPRTGTEASKGRAGLLAHFDLANRDSVMAVQTEDLGRAVGEGFELLGRASGSQIRGCSLDYEKFLRTAGDQTR